MINEPTGTPVGLFFFVIMDKQERLSCTAEGLQEFCTLVESTLKPQLAAGYVPVMQDPKTA